MKEKRFIYPIEIILTGYHFLYNSNSRLGNDTYCPKRSMLLYAVQPEGDFYLPLNRDYKPLGISFYSEYVTYSDYPFLLIPKNMMDVSSLEAHKHTDIMFTFNDATYPDIKKTKTLYRNTLFRIFGMTLDGFVSRISQIEEKYLR